MPGFLSAFDGSRQSIHAFEQAIELAELKGAKLRVLAVIETPELHEPEERKAIIEAFRGTLEEAMDKLKPRAADSSVPVTLEIREGHPVDLILEEIRDQDIEHVFIGHRGQKGLIRELLMGSVSRRIADYAPCTVTIARQSGPKR